MSNGVIVKTRSIKEWGFYGYATIVDVYDDSTNELIISSEGKTEYEFFNYLTFLCSKKDIEYIKEKYHGIDDDQYIDYGYLDDYEYYDDAHDDEDWDVV